MRDLDAHRVVILDGAQPDQGGGLRAGNQQGTATGKVGVGVQREGGLVDRAGAVEQPADTAQQGGDR